MKLIDKLKNHYAEKGMKSIKIPELETEIFWKPLTIKESMEVNEISENAYEVGINLIIKKALDSEGKRLFAQGDKAALMIEVDSEILTRIVEAIQSDSEEVKKN